jgi:hypothetical protein
MTRSTLTLLLGAALLLAGDGARAEGLDASKPIQCKLNGSAQCDAAASCIEVTLEQIDLADELTLDFENQRISSKDNDRTSPIDDVDLLETVLVLQGHQAGRGWTIVIDRTSGHLSAALAETAGAFVISGECSAD